jgi:uridine kinase
MGGRGILKVAIDGVDGAGKTSLADRLAQVLDAGGIRVIRAGIDGFHNPRAIRHARGKDSPEGFFRDSYDLAALRRELLDPLGPRGSGMIRRAVFDWRTDSVVQGPGEMAERTGALLFDGIFLHRPELRAYWDVSIFLDVPFADSYRRMAQRDGSDPDPFALANRRYLAGQKLYCSECDPRRQADILVDYTDLDTPLIGRD